MNNEEINKKIKSSFTNISPDNFREILSDAKREKGSVVNMTERNNNSIFKRIAAIAAALIIVVGAVTLVAVNPFDDGIAATVAIDVNPSVYIQLDIDEKVIDVVPFNEDGQKIIGSMDFKGADLTVTVNALIGSMLRNGYLSDIQNSILVTVEGDDHKANENVRKRVESEIAAVLKGGNFTASILNQEIDGDDSLEEFAEKHSISEGKAKLVNQLAAQFPHHSAEELAKLSINELNILAQNTENVKSKGQPSKKAYITEDKAYEIAFKKIGVAKADVTEAFMKFESDDGVMVYEVDVYVDNFEYEVEINAVTGEVTDFEGEEIDMPITVTPSKESTENAKPQSNSKPEATQSANNNSSVIVEAEAKGIALKRAGVTENSISRFVCKTDVDDGVKVFDIEFVSGNYEYSVEINAKTGKVIDYERDYIDKDDDDYKKPAQTQKPKETTTAPAKSYIGTQKAKTIALNKAGVAATKIRGYSCELDKDDGVVVYDIEFLSGNYEYSVEVNAVSGAVVSYERDVLDD